MTGSETIQPVAWAMGLAVLSVLLWSRRSGTSVLATRSILSGRKGVLAISRPRIWGELRRMLPDRKGRAVDVLPLLDGVAAALRAGLTPEQALRMSLQDSTDSRVHVALEPVLDAAAQGCPLGGVWQRVARKQGNADLSALARAWTLSERLGCPLSDAVAASAQMSRSRTVLEQRLDAATAGARATTTLLSVLPIAGMGLALLLGLSPVRLYGNPLGLASAGSGLVLLCVGRWVVARMVASVREAV